MNPRRETMSLFASSLININLRVQFSDFANDTAASRRCQFPWVEGLTTIFQLAPTEQSC
jgi:hypothetical protein